MPTRPKKISDPKPVPVAAPTAPVPPAPKKRTRKPNTGGVLVTPPAPNKDVTPAPTATSGMPIMYPRVNIVEHSTTSPQGPLTPDEVVVMMEWETEPQYQARMVREKPDSKPEHWLFGEDYHCIDSDGHKVRCHRNANNRPFDMDWCEALIHTILHGQWAGPLMVPGETINGETVRISRYGRVLSGQHQCTALKLADEQLQKSRAKQEDGAPSKYPAWDGHDHPVIETVIITGLSEDERVLRTIDYVKPRTIADMFYTMEVFRENTRSERKYLTRILETAVDVLWERTDTKGYKTHPEVVGFLERHKRLLRCVEHLFIEDHGGKAEGRRISKLRLSAGRCAALCYLMGCSSKKTTDHSDEYRNSNPPSEKGLDWSLWDKAREFWANLAGDRLFEPVRRALNNLANSSPTNEKNIGLGGIMAEKLAILAAAWERWKEHPATGAGPPFIEEDLAPDGLLWLSYSDLDAKGNPLPAGQIRLINEADFQGIDCPTSLGKRTKVARQQPPDPPLGTPAEIARAAQEALQRRARSGKK